MPRHSKNSTSNPIFTYHERKKVKGVGTLKERLGKDSMRKFEQCWICLRNAENPVSTPYGHIFCKMCIISNLLAQKKMYSQKKKEYINYIKELKKRKNDKVIREKEKEKQKFIDDIEFIKKNEKEMSGEKRGLLDISNNFWISNISKVKKDVIHKELKPPSKIIVCPISKKPLKTFDLIPINPEVLDKKDPTKENWVCSFSKNNIDHHKAILIKKTGQIILKSFFETYIYGKKNSWEIIVGENDFIELHSGGTAFCLHSNVEKSLYREALL